MPSEPCLAPLRISFTTCTYDPSLQLVDNPLFRVPHKYHFLHEAFLSFLLLCLWFHKRSPEAMAALISCYLLSLVLYLSTTPQINSPSPLHIMFFALHCSPPNTSLHKPKITPLSGKPLETHTCSHSLFSVNVSPGSCPMRSQRPSQGVTKD